MGNYNNHTFETFISLFVGESMWPKWIGEDNKRITKRGPISSLHVTFYHLMLGKIRCFNVKIYAEGTAT